ncbi:amino acid permease-domain-containing protein [Auriculariales sp. MPI-PUGE-AT-0066]|nr:amino acid permease-domain-containing protein [Auriculariales sp. MPI-PUGE-AT-0066]
MESRSRLRERWFDKVSPLPPQLSLQCVHASSVHSRVTAGSVIGTGVFISTLSTSLRQAGPGGVFIAYVLTSTIVYATSTSNAEMMAHMPNVGGPVGLADVFVDPALGFALGWGAWYHWAIIIPVQIAAAGRLMKSYISTSVTAPATILYWVSIAAFIATAVGLNFLGAKKFGNIHIAFAVMKIGALVLLAISTFIIDWSPVSACNTFPAPEGCPKFNATLVDSLPCVSSHGDSDEFTIGTTYWRCPGPFGQPFGTKGSTGSFLGVLQVLIQAVFSFNGVEVGSVPGREVKDPTNNIPRAVRRVWLRVTILYLTAVLAAGFVVPSNHPSLKNAPSITGSPWAIAFATSTTNPFPRYILTAIFMLSALSAASSDIFVASRYLFFLARRGHAPWVFGSLYKSEPTLPELSMMGYRLSHVSQPPSAISLRQQTPETRHIALAGEPVLAYNSPSTPTMRQMNPWGPNSPEGGFRSPTSPDSAHALLQPHRRMSSVSGAVTSPAILLVKPAPPVLNDHRPSTLIMPASLSNTLSRSRPTTGQSASSAISQPLTVHTTTTRVNTGQSTATSGPFGRISPSDAEKSPIMPIPQPASPISHRPRLRRANTIMTLAPPEVVVPWVGVLFGGVVGLLVFMAPAAQSDARVKTAFNFFTQMTNCASLVSWIGMLITYLRFYAGTEYAKSKDPTFEKTHEESLYNNRAWGQPWVAVYGLTWCTLILLGQGWSVFTSPGVMRIAELQSDPVIVVNPEVGAFAVAFCVAYLPVALFLLLYFGYKLVYQTPFVAIEKMGFARGDVPPPSIEPSPTTLWERIYTFIL